MNGPEERKRRRRRTVRAVAVVVLAVLAAGPAASQILRDVGRLTAPITAPVAGTLREVTGDVGRTLDQTGRQVGQQLDPIALRDLRQERMSAFARENRRVVELDPRGFPAVRGEVLALSPTADALAAARRAGFTVVRETKLDGLDLQVVVLGAPDGLSVREAIRRLRKLDPDGAYDFDHLYFDAGAAARRAAAPAAPVAASNGPRPVRAGLVDTGVDAGHPAFAGLRLEQRSFAGGGVVARPHGTAVASLLAGRSGAFSGAAPGAELFVADVYGSGPTGGTAEAVARALAWMAQARVPVVNVSLVGPDNAVLRAAVRALAARGQVVVAAVGNDGPSAPPLYPASYPEVVAVSAVDARGRVLFEAGRATHLDFCAPGADMAAASPGGGYAPVRGTSFAAPLVAGRLARLLSTPDRTAAHAAVEALARDAERARECGRGLVAASARVAPAAVAARGAALDR